MSESLGRPEGANIRVATHVLKGLGPTEVGWEVTLQKGRQLYTELLLYETGGEE